MTQDRAEAKVNEGMVKEQVRKIVGDRSTDWASKLGQDRIKVQGKTSEARDTRRFADGRTRR